MKLSHGLLIAAGVVIAVDTFAGYKAGNNAGTLPTWYQNSLGAIEDKVPGPPLWLWLAGAAAGAHFFLHK